MRIPTVRILLSALILGLGFLAIPANGVEILWSQYCQHFGKMKLLVHLDTDPTAATEGEPVKLWLRGDVDGEWKLADTQPVDPLTATSLFIELKGYQQLFEHEQVSMKSRDEFTFKALMSPSSRLVFDYVRLWKAE